MGGGEIAILDEDVPACPPGGLLVRTEASGLCSGELMDWYMDRKIPHVLGHEVAGIVVESEDERFPVGARVAPHHHAPCMSCELCRRGAHVHCDQWKRTKLVPGGMAEYFAVPRENLTDTHLVPSEMRAVDAALMEPLGCVVKSLVQGGLIGGVRGTSVAIVGLGTMGLLHALLLGALSKGASIHNLIVGYDLLPDRVDWARRLGLESREVEAAEGAESVIVCPGTSSALGLARKLVTVGGQMILFSPLPPPGEISIDINGLYFADIRITTSYSCGPTDTTLALQYLDGGAIKAEHVVSHFISIDDLPAAYRAMKRGEILKPMVVFDC